MQKLHMVGFTTDHRGLIFSVRRNAKSGGYVVNVDASIIEAIDELKALLAAETSAESDSDTEATRPQSALSVREIQARLRRGRTIDQVAREAGVEPSWISRFAVPVLAEQAEVIRAARATHMIKQRNNVSALSLGEAVYRNIAERGVTDPRDQLDKEWRARQLTEGMWLVTFTYTSRGRENKAQWEYDESSRVVRARGRLGGSIGFREGPRRLAPPEPRQVASPTAARATKKSAAKANTAKKNASKKVTGKKAAGKKAAAKKSAVKKTAVKKTAAKKTAGKKTAAKKVVANKPPAPNGTAMKRPPGATPAAPRTVVARKVAAEAPSTARQSPSRQAARRVATLRRAAAARLEAEAEKATRRDIAAVRKAAKRTVVIPPRLVPPPVPAGPLLVDEPMEDVESDLDLRWDAAEPNGHESDADVEVVAEEVVVDDVDIEEVVVEETDDEADGEVAEPEPEPQPEPGPPPEPDDDGEPEVEAHAEPERAPNPAPQPHLQIPRPTRREPLRARPGSGEGNGPIFRNDLAPAAGESHAVARSAVGQPADVPLSMPLEPIEPPPRRRRLRPLRGR